MLITGKVLSETDPCGRRRMKHLVTSDAARLSKSLKNFFSLFGLALAEECLKTLNILPAHVS